MRTFDASEAIALVATTATQLDYLARVGLIQPRVPASRRGVSRKFDARNLLELATAAELIDAGISVVDVKRALDCIAENWTRVIDRRQKDLVLGLFRLARSPKRTDPLPQLVPAKDLGELANTGYTIVAAVPISNFVRTIEKGTGERLS